MRISAELTDTYGTDANYSWVRRIELDMPDTASDLTVVRRVKKEFGLEGTRAKRRDNFGDHLALWNLDGDCVVLFINWNMDHYGV